MTCMLLVKGLPLSCQIQMYSCHKASCSQLIGTSFFLSCVHFNEKMLLFPLPNPNLVYLCPAKLGEISWPEKAHSSLCSSVKFMLADLYKISIFAAIKQDYYGYHDRTDNSLLAIPD